MSGGAVRRTVVVLLLYALGAWVVVLVGEWLQRVLALPMIFDRLLHAGLYLGVPVAALLAWHYPRLAVGSDDGGRPTASAGERDS